MSFRWNVSAKREIYVRWLSFKDSGAYAYVWNKPYKYVPHDFYLRLTFKNLFTLSNQLKNEKILQKKLKSRTQWTKGMTD